MIKISGSLAYFLIDPRCRIYRHLLLFFSVTTIGLNYYTDLIERQNLMRDFTQSFLLLAPIYLSVFVLTPRLLLRNKVDVCAGGLWLHWVGIHLFLSAA